MSKGGSSEPISRDATVSIRDSGSFNDAKNANNRQREKIRQIGKTLRQAGFVTLDDQARALGLSRSTMWKLLRADHKASGLHAKSIGRMLAHKELPPTVRSLLREYVIEKAQGHYGHGLLRRRRFASYFWDMPELGEFLKHPAGDGADNPSNAIPRRQRRSTGA